MLLDSNPHPTGNLLIAPPPPGSINAAEVTVWTSPARAPLAGRLLDEMGHTVRPIGVGGPRSGEIDDLGKQLDCPAGNDLRKLLIDQPAAFLLVTSLRDVSIAELRSAAEAGTKIVSLEPLTVELDELARRDAAVPDAAVTVAPSFARSPGYLAAADPQESLATPRMVRLTSLGQPIHGSLVGRLLDAWTTLLEFVALPETIHASLTGPTQPVRQIAGQLAAHARIANGSAVLVEASDNAAQPRRELSVASQDSHLSVTDTHYELRENTGRLLDASDPPPDQAGPPPSFEFLVADQWRKLLDRPAPAASPLGPALACVHACILSARTGQPERPDTLLQLQQT
ncbi:MAG: hypothetical protein AAGH99_11540 [Planctomycetota bacterium]